MRRVFGCGPVLPIGLLVLALFTSACASGGVGTEPPRAASSAHSTIDTEHVVVTAGEALGIEELLARADEALEAGRYEDALRHYRRLSSAVDRGAGTRRGQLRLRRRAGATPSQRCERAGDQVV